jgi:hypothetical protein
MTSINGTTFGTDLLPLRIRDHHTLILHEILVQGVFWPGSDCTDSLDTLHGQTWTKIVSYFYYLIDGHFRWLKVCNFSNTPSIATNPLGNLLQKW